MVVSPGNGLALTVCGEQAKGHACGVSQGMFHLGGYFAAPLLTGVVMQSTDMRWGFRSIMFSSVLGIICLGFAWCFADKFYAGEASDSLISDDCDSSPRSKRSASLN